MLSLAATTDPIWTERALARLDDVLVDHAHCEKKAASTALSLLFRYPEQAPLQEPLSRLAREELVHFEQVLALLRERGVRFRHQRPSPYAGRLVAAARSHEPARLLDLLLCAALIEARSCERFRLLADAVPDPTLADFYRGLLASEARHHGVYVELARSVAGEETVRDRLAELAEHEAAVLREMPALARMHT
jgi:tRNA-(ms[2]io[6]A)-hydroxylase